MVQIQSKQERGFIANSLRNLIPDILVACAGASYFNAGMLGFFGIILGLQCLYFLIWLKTFIWRWLLFWISGRKKMARIIEATLYKDRYPQPPEYVSGIEDYLLQVSNDNKIHPTLRVKAATDLGTMAGIKVAGCPGGRRPPIWTHACNGPKMAESICSRFAFLNLTSRSFKNS
jgi:hypothetical protein